MRNNYLAGKTDTIPRPRYYQYRVPRQVKELPERYNFTTENAIKHPEERAKAVIVHYTGKNETVVYLGLP